MKYLLNLLFTLTVLFSVTDAAIASISSQVSMPPDCNREAVQPEGNPDNSSEKLRVSYVKGRVVVTRPGEVCAPLIKGMEISITDIIQTGPNGFVSLVFEQTHSFNIHPETVGQIYRCDSQQRYCIRSALSGKVRKNSLRTRGKNVEFYVSMPHLSAAVMG